LVLGGGGTRIGEPATNWHGLIKTGEVATIPFPESSDCE